MPYYAPPGGSLTAATAAMLQAQSLAGLGALVANPRDRKITVPPAILAARMTAAREGAAVMTGMGILPSTNVRYTRKIVPIALALRRQRELQNAALQGLGGKGAAKGMPMIRRQAGFFMGPGGGPGGGPFQFPGFTMSGIGLGQDSTDIDVVTGLPCDDPRANCGPIVGPAVTGQIPTTTIPAPTTLTPPTAKMPPIIQTSIPFYQGPSGVPSAFIPVAAKGPSFFDQSTFGVSNKVLVGVLAGVVVLTGMSRRRRR